jgi:hypothetical protein
VYANQSFDLLSSWLERNTKSEHPKSNPIIPGIVPAGGCCPSHAKAIRALTGTSKNTARDTMAGETRLSVKLNKVCPKNWAPIINPANKTHSMVEYPVKLDLVISATGKISTAHVK